MSPLRDILARRYIDPPWTWVYAVGMGRYLKVGETSRPATRFTVIQSSCPEPLELLAIFPDSVRSESSVLSEFAHLRARGEWFRRTEDIEEWARGIMRGQWWLTDEPDLSALFDRFPVLALAPEVSS